MKFNNILNYIIETIKIIIRAIRGSLGYICLFLNTLFIALLFVPIGYIKKYSHNKKLHKFLLSMLHRLGELWVSINYLIVKLIGSLKLNIEGLDELTSNNHLSKHNWYLQISNHQSWNDIFILQFLTNRKIPFQKFLVKEQMRKFPVMGFVWDAIDCPFLKRSKNDIKQDLANIRKSCQKIKILPSTVVSFVEGTRFTYIKHQDQKSPYKYLLSPKAGGLACLLDELSGTIGGIIDTTLVYNPRQANFWDIFTGKLKTVNAKISFIEIPDWLKEKHLIHADYSEYKEEFNQWINSIWQSKDEYLAKYYN